MTTIDYKFAYEVPLTHDTDVVVVGGGPGGLGAAVMAARMGARTLLVERHGFLGGMAVAGEVHPFMSNHVGGVCLDRPVYLEWIRQMKRYYASANPLATLQSEEATAAEDLYISKDIAMLAAEDLCLEEGVKLLYHHELTDVLVRDGAIDALILFSKSGYSAVRGRVCIDCTGDADLAARAGCEYEQGGPSGHSQPMTLCFKLSHVDRDRIPERKDLFALYDAAKGRGEIDCPRENVLYFHWCEPDVVHFNTTRVIQRDATSGEELSDAEIEGRRQMREFLCFLRKDVPGFENAEIHSIAHQIGIRESRRVKGIDFIGRSAFETAAKFADAIARVRYPIDIHNPDGTGTEIVHLPPGEWYEIPYGCIVAKDVSNLLIGGRPISVDQAIHSSMRVMPSACSVGQAAGAAAAMACREGIPPRELDGKGVREALCSFGANL